MLLPIVDGVIMLITRDDAEHDAGDLEQRDKKCDEEQQWCRGDFLALCRAVHMFSYALHDMTSSQVTVPASGPLLMSHTCGCGCGGLLRVTIVKYCHASL